MVVLHSFNEVLLRTSIIHGGVIRFYHVLLGKSTINGETIIKNTIPVKSQVRLYWEPK
jgi:hypothetical protein